MAGNTLQLDDLLEKDHLGVRIAERWVDWDNRRREKVNSWKEVRQYVYATDTTQTTNSKLPWKNKTTIPKLCQIRDNLFANYMATLFPKRKWLVWEAGDENSNTPEVKEVIRNYMQYAISRPNFKVEMEKLIYDYIDYGNMFVMPDWSDETQEQKNGTKVGYVGPTLKRINPLDIVFNPVAESFSKTPKIIKSQMLLGDVKEYLERLATDENREMMENLFKYMKELRSYAMQTAGDTSVKDSYFQMDGFTSFRDYLNSDYVELLTFYGDYYDSHSDEFYRNHIITVVDRHKVISNVPNPSSFGHSGIHHAGWRTRQDNLWAMGPLDNLVGMQYRIDHVENLKADVFDLTAFPPLKIKGLVEDFEWAPFERISVGDDGDVEIIAPPYQVLQMNIEIDNLQKQMEEMAGAPKEAMGFRTPGEKTKYEVQRMENAASRIFLNKSMQVEEKILEPVLNDMLELSRRRIGPTSLRVFDDELDFFTFVNLKPEQLSTAIGRIRPIAARHFAEKADLIQNLNSFFQSPLGQDEQVKLHFSSIKTAKMMSDLLEINEWELVTPFVRLAEQADAQRIAQAAQQQVAVESQTPSGLSQDDYDENPIGGVIQQPPPAQPQESLF